MPTPAPAVNRPATPAFVSQGTWRKYLSEDESVLVVPLPTFFDPNAIMWSTDTGLDLRLSHGYFLGPGANGTGRFGPVPRHTDDLLEQARRTGTIPALTDADRAQVRADLRYWRTAIILLQPGPQAPESLRVTLDALVGPGTFTGGVWTWDVRALREQG
jgi:dolichyl-phosphate beta-glucosyltransferase